MLLIHFGSYAQFEDAIRTGRPGHTIGAGTLETGFFQVQSGIELFERTQPSQTISSTRNNNTVRYGIADRWELSAVFVTQKEVYTPGLRSEFETKGLSSAQVGFRYAVLQRAENTAIAFQSRFRLPVNSKDYKIDKVAPVMVLAIGQNLPYSCQLNSNLSMDFNGNNANPTYRYSSRLGFMMGERFRGFAEVFGTFQDFDMLFDAGFGYLVSPDLQLDLSGGFGNNEGVNDLFVSMGISWRTSFNQ